ncbi:MAG: Fur family ferric uptake transcriptional regulator [Maribacter sp.]|jgi:Fur family ferric uptake transcriptional regulator
MQESQVQKVKDLFSKYLEDKKLRKTPERFALLEEIYTRNDHFDAEQLYIDMKTKNFKVSRATVYNTLELLAECNLIRKHHFGQNLSFFEKSYSYRQHDHLICTECNKILEFCDPRIQSIRDMVADHYDFNIEFHSLNFYGTCSDEKCKSNRKK